LAELSIPSILLFLFGRPGLCLLVAVSIAGYGSLFQKDKKLWDPLCFSAGLYVKVLLLWILGFLQLWNTPVLWTVHLLGLGFAFYRLKKLGFPSLPKLPKTWSAWAMLGLFGLWLAITFIRCSAPPYFIDYLQYHLPLSLTFLNAEGFCSLEDFFFGALNSNFAPETFHLLILGLSGDSSTPIVFNLFLFLFILYQLYIFLRSAQLEKQFYLCSMMLMSCQTFFHSTVYGKTEVFLMVICMDLLLRWQKIKN
jgi:hypothetical protein